MSKEAAQRHIDVRLLLLGIVSFGSGILLLCFEATRMAGAALSAASIACFLRLPLGPSGLMRSLAVWGSGLLIGTALSLVPTGGTSVSPGVLPPTIIYLAAVVLMWLAFSHQRPTTSNVITRCAAGMGIGAVILLVGGHLVWLVLIEYVESQAIEAWRKEDSWWWDRLFDFVMWCRVTPLILALLGVVLLRIGLASPVGRRPLVRPASTGVALGLVAGAVTAVLFGRFELRQRALVLIFAEGSAYEFAPQEPTDLVQLQRAASTLRRRLDAPARGTFRVTVRSSSSIRVSVHRRSRFSADPRIDALVKGVCGYQGLLEFRILARNEDIEPDILAQYVESLQTSGPRAEPNAAAYRWFEIDFPEDFLSIKNLDAGFDARKNPRVVVERIDGHYYVLAHADDDYTLTHRAGLPEWSCRKARLDRDFYTGGNVIQFTLDDVGGALLGALTRRNIQRQLAIFLDDAAVVHAAIQSEIRSSGQISGNFTFAQASRISRILNSDPLPIQLQYIGRVN